MPLLAYRRISVKFAMIISLNFMLFELIEL